MLAFIIGIIFRAFINFEVDYIGFLIPGLIASWIDRQGIVRTVSIIIIEAGIVHLFLMLLYKMSI